MFKNVLVGVDGRPTRRDGIALATRLLDPQGKLTLAHVHEDLQSPLHAAAPRVIETEREASQELLERERSETNVTAEIISLVSGSPGAALHQQAEEQHADLIVVGSCSRGAFGRAMVGNDTRAALHGAPSAVAIAPVATQSTPRSSRGSASPTTSRQRARRRSHSHEPYRAHQPGPPGTAGLAGRDLQLFRGRATRRERRGAAHRRQQPLEGAARSPGPRGVRHRRRGAGQFQRPAGPACGRLTQLRPAAASGARQHHHLPRASRALLTARTAPHRHPHQVGNGPQATPSKPARLPCPEQASAVLDLVGGCGAPTNPSVKTPDAPPS
jgi:nucleotide-binding universal stress UspA family protein